MTTENRAVSMRRTGPATQSLLGLWIVLLAAGTSVGELPKNVAFGKKYTLAPRPNYGHCSDPGDRSQLTDGHLTQGYFWTQRGTVGWNHTPYARITIDLGRVEPIGGVSFRTAAGTAGVCWPAAIRLLVSDNGKQYFDVGDLVVLDHRQNGPWPTGYAVRRLVTSALRTHGRFVMLVVVAAPGSGYIFTDEVEVFRGPEAALHDPPGGERIASITDRLLRIQVGGCFRRRYENDAANITRAVREAKLPDKSVEKRLLDRIAQVAGRLQATAPPTDPTFRTVVPFNKAHGDLFAVQAALWHALGRADLTAWVPSTWDPVAPYALPPLPPGEQKTGGTLAASCGTMEVHMMRGEYRAAALNLANSTNRLKTVRLRIDGLPGGPVPPSITVAEVPWTDTAPGQLVAAALPTVQPKDGHWAITVQPGLVRQVWLTVHGTDVPAGLHAGAMVVTAAGAAPIRIPIHVRVYPLTFPKRTTLWLGGWSYTNGSGSYGVTTENRTALLEHLQTRLVNAPWANSGVMMHFKFTTDGSIRLDTKEFDGWIAQWPHARAYLVFLSQGDYHRNKKPSFAGATIGTPQFKRRVRVWISAWVSHLRGKGIAPGQLALLIQDEPHEGTNVAGTIAWAKAIHAAEPKVRIWCDPTYGDPGKAPPELFTVSDIICPNRPMWLSRGASFARFYRGQQRTGHTLQFYSCSGPARLLDPYGYYRLQAWHCWQLGATGSFFWAFGDNGYASSWNEYLARHGPYTPLFLDRHSVVAGKQMEAIRESAEDYQYFIMLRNAVDKAKSAGRADAVLDTAQWLLEHGADEVLSAPRANSPSWYNSKDRTKADAVRLRILEALTQLP